MATAKKDKYSFLDNPQRILVGGAVIGIGGFILYKFGRKIFTTIQKKNTQKSADDNPEIRQAMALRSAINPSGSSWMRSFDTTNTKAVFETASLITNLDNVSSAYSKLYSSDLLKDLQSELSTSDYQKFLTLVSSNKSKTGGSAPVTFAKKDQLVVAKADIYIRSSPDASYHGAVYELNANKNILRKAKVGEFLGYATGNQSFDVKNNVRFIEVAYLVKKENLPVALKPLAGKKFVFWVSSSTSYVDIFPYYKEMLARYPGTQNEVAYKKPLSYYSGVAGLFSQAVITTRPSMVLNEKMQSFIKVQSGTLLGEYLMSLDTGKIRYYKFRTVDNTERWIKAEDARIREMQ